MANLFFYMKLEYMKTFHLKYFYERSLFALTSQKPRKPKDPRLFLFDGVSFPKLEKARCPAYRGKHIRVLKPITHCTSCFMHFCRPGLFYRKLAKVGTYLLVMGCRVETRPSNRLVRKLVCQEFSRNSSSSRLDLCISAANRIRLG